MIDPYPCGEDVLIPGVDKPTFLEPSRLPVRQFVSRLGIEAHAPQERRQRAVKREGDAFDGASRGNLHALDPRPRWHSAPEEATGRQDIPQANLGGEWATRRYTEAIPVTEDAPTLSINPYGWSKLMTERILVDAASAHGLRHVILRY